MFYDGQPTFQKWNTACVLILHSLSDHTVHLSYIYH